jgi:hypothetical protein
LRTRNLQKGQRKIHRTLNFYDWTKYVVASEIKSPGPSDIVSSWLGLFGKPIHSSLCVAHHPCVQAFFCFWKPEIFQLLCHYMCKAGCCSTALCTH